MDLTFSKLASSSLRRESLWWIFPKLLCSVFVEGYHFWDFVLAFLCIFVWSKIGISLLETSTHQVELGEQGKSAACIAILDVHTRILLKQCGYLSSMCP